jgi:hypothetical protein
MMKRITIPIFVLICLLVAGSVLAASSTNYRLDWFTPLTGGGGGTAGSANYTVSFTVGQSTIGTSASENYVVCTGFWCGIANRVANAIKVYLPLILKNW